MAVFQSGSATRPWVAGQSQAILPASRREWLAAQTRKPAKRSLQTTEATATNYPPNLTLASSLILAVRRILHKYVKPDYVLVV